MRALAFLFILMPACAEAPAECGLNQASVIVITVDKVVSSVPGNDGQVDRVVNCPVQGSARITGTIKQSSMLLGGVSYDLQLALMDCFDDGLTLNGTVAAKIAEMLLGETETISSSALRIRDDCIGCDSPIDATCSVADTSKGDPGTSVARCFPDEQA